MVLTRLQIWGIWKTMGCLLCLKPRRQHRRKMKIEIEGKDCQEINVGGNIKMCSGGTEWLVISRAAT